MPGIEFLPERPDEADGEELLGGSRRPVPRWVIAAGVAVIAVAAVVVMVVRNDSATPRQRVLPPIPSASRSIPQVPIDVALNGDIGPALRVGAGPLLDVAIAGDTTWVLEPAIIYTVSRTGTTSRTAVPPPRLPLDRASRLVVDVPAGVLWVVEEGMRAGRAIAYDLATMRLMRELRNVGFVNGVAAMDGHLYLTTDNRILDVGTGRRPVQLGAVSGTLGPIVADTARDRLLVADYGRNTHIWAVYPKRGRIAAPVTIRVTKGSLAVADGAVWLAGFNTGAGVLMRLDPKTLRPVVHSELDRVLEPGAVLVASGVVVVWVRSGSELRCVDAATGQPLQRWNVDGAVASGGANAVIATTGGAFPLRLRNCSG